MNIFSIKSKLTISLLTILTSSIITIVLYHINMSSLNRKIDLLKDDINELIIQSQKLSNQTYLVTSWVINYSRATDESEKSNISEEITNSQNELDHIYDELIKKFKKSKINGYDDTLKQISNEITNFYDECEKVKNGSKDDLFTKGLTINKYCYNLSSSLSQFTVRDINEEVKKIFTFIRYLSGVSAFIISGICLFFIMSLLRSISNPLFKLVKAMAEAEKGILNVRLNVKRNRDEFKYVGESFNQMLACICDMISKVLETSDNLATNSQQLSSASVESAANLSEISKNVNDINKSSLEISDNLEKTTNSVESFSESAQKLHLLQQQLLKQL